MIKGLLAFAFSLIAGFCYAEDFPARYSVTGVAANDQLNIRSGPNASFDIVGTLGPYAANVEVLRVSEDRKWGFVGAGEANGWTSMRFLDRHVPQNSNSIPRPMRCFGTEPFWDISLALRGTDYSEMGGPTSILNEVSEAAAGRAYLGVFQEGPTLVHTLMIAKELCGDGMSDREFGFSARLFTEAPDGNHFQRGCCTLSVD